jgi:phytanoyl-CoA hydroxylase
VIVSRYETAFDRDGYQIIRQVIPPSIVLALTEAISKIQDSTENLPADLLSRLTFERDLPADRRDGIAAAEVGNAIFLIGDPVAFNAIFFSLLDQREIISAGCRALGCVDLTAHFMNVTIKNPRFGRGIGWHRDFPNDYACTQGSSFVRAMICLDGMSEASGATAFIKDTHKITDDEALDLRQKRDRSPDQYASPEFACCEPGDMVLIHPKVLHGGFINSSSQLRRNIVLQMGDASVPLVKVPHPEQVCGYRMR